MDPADPLEMRKIETLSGRDALDSVDFQISAARWLHLGRKWCGKSSLMKLLGGSFITDEGGILLMEKSPLIGLRAGC
jgi:ABC-type sugar transport system ATPase subunit